MARSIECCRGLWHRPLTATFVIVALVAALGCRRQQITGAPTQLSPTDLEAVLTAEAQDTGMKLVAYSVRDTFDVGDTIALGYLLRNYGPARQLRLDPGFFVVRVYDSSGKAVPVKTKEWYGSTGDAPDIVIPRGGIVGQVFDLACGHVGIDTIESCNHQIEITQPGRYSATVAYAPPLPPDGRRALYPTLTSDTVRFAVVRAR